MYANLTFIIAAVLASLLPTVVNAEPVEFKRIEIDLNFRSEGVAVADVDNDQLTDVIVGDYWYKNPKWTPHQIRTPRKPNRGGYTEAFAVYAKDFDGDKWIDVFVIPFHGKDAKWYQNPQNKSGHWTERVAFRGTGNETRLYPNLFSDGNPVFLMGVEGRMSWAEIAKDPTQPWVVHPLDKGNHGAGQYYHGLGVGDLNGDGRKDLVTGWRFYAHGFSPEKANDPSELAWFEVVGKKGETPTLVKHSVDIRSGVGAQFVTSDYNGDRLMDIVVSNRKGVFVFEQVK